MVRTLKIKNMVCPRCISAVEKIFGDLSLPVENIQLGEVKTSFASNKLEELKTALANNGFEIIEDKKSQTVEKIKNLIIDLIFSEKLTDLTEPVSKILVRNIGKDYSYMSKVFSNQEKITIEKYIILQKIERAKELLLYDELNLNEIADSLGYKNVSHLSRQFKEVTQCSPSEFKRKKVTSRKPIDNVLKQKL